MVIIISDLHALISSKLTVFQLEGFTRPINIITRIVIYCSVHNSTPYILIMSTLSKNLDTEFVFYFETIWMKSLFCQWLFLLLKVLLTFPRMKSTASCKMNLRNYPMDDQICHLALESCEYLQTITSFCSFYLCSSCYNLVKYSPFWKQGCFSTEVSVPLTFLSMDLFLEVPSVFIVPRMPTDR